MDGVQWVPSQDTCSEIRREVYRSRIDRGILSGTGGRLVSLTSELGIVTEFLAEEFGELTANAYRLGVTPDGLPDVMNWAYPGAWTTVYFDELEEVFAHNLRGFLFSRSGSFTLAVHKITLWE